MHTSLFNSDPKYLSVSVSLSVSLSVCLSLSQKIYITLTKASASAGSNEAIDSFNNDMMTSSIEKH